MCFGIVDKPSKMTKIMGDLLQAVASIANRTFFGINPLPVPLYILYPLDLIKKIPDLKSVGFVLLVTNKAIMLSYMNKGTMKCILNCLGFLMASLLLHIRNTSLHMYFAEIFSFLALRLFLEERYNLMSLLLFLLCCTDTLFLPVAGLLSIVSAVKTYEKLIDHRNNVRKTLCGGLVVLSKVTVIPILLSVGLIWLDMLVRNRHSKESTSYPIEFQATLVNFDVSQGFSNAHKPSAPVETDAYVMDRSIITIMSKKHNAFFTVTPKGVIGSRNFPQPCKIHKVHEADFEDEEPRFIKNGDYVKLVPMDGSDDVLTMNRSATDTKFVDLTVESANGNASEWKVVTDGYLKARFSTVSFVNEKSGDHLSARIISGKPVLSGSLYSELESRKFYITDNTNHEYFKVAFVDYRASLTTESYPTLSRVRKLLVHLSRFDWKFNTKDESISASKVLKCILFGCISVVAVLLNEISAERYNVGFRLSEATKIFIGAFVAVLLFFPIIGFKSYALATYGILAFSSMVADLMVVKKGKVVLSRMNKGK